VFHCVCVTQPTEGQQAQREGETDVSPHHTREGMNTPVAIPIM